MPDDHRPVMPQVTDADDLFGTHTRPGKVTISPSRSSSANARRTVLRTTPNSAASEVSDGRAEPGATSASRSRSVSAIRAYVPQGVDRTQTGSQPSPHQRHHRQGRLGTSCVSVHRRDTGGQDAGGSLDW